MSDGPGRDLDADQAAYETQGWKFRVKYDAATPTYVARARKAWTLHICEADAPTPDDARASLLELMDDVRRNPNWPEPA